MLFYFIARLQTSREYNGLLLVGPKNERCKVLATETCNKPLSDLVTPVTRALVGFDNRVLVIEVPLEERSVMIISFPVNLPTVFLNYLLCYVCNIKLSVCLLLFQRSAYTRDTRNNFTRLGNRSCVYQSSQ